MKRMLYSLILNIRQQAPSTHIESKHARLQQFTEAQLSWVFYLLFGQW